MRRTRDVRSARVSPAKHLLPPSAGIDASFEIVPKVVYVRCTMHTYVALYEVRPLHGCELDPQAIAGAFVRSYVQASSKDDARSRIGVAFVASHFEVLREQWLAKDDDVEWEEAESDEAEDCCDEAVTTGAVVFGPFHTWPQAGRPSQ